MTATSFEVVEEWAGHYVNPALRSDKVWAGCYTADGHYLAAWGRRSTAYQSGQVSSCRPPVRFATP